MVIKNGPKNEVNVTFRINTTLHMTFCHAFEHFKSVTFHRSFHPHRKSDKMFLKLFENVKKHFENVTKLFEIETKLSEFNEALQKHLIF